MTSIEKNCTKMRYSHKHFHVLNKWYHKVKMKKKKKSKNNNTFLLVIKKLINIFKIQNHNK